MSDHTRRAFLRNTSATAVGSTALFATGTTTGDPDIPNVIEDDDGRGTIHIIRSTDASKFHHPYLLFKPDPPPKTKRPLFATLGQVRDVSSQEEALQQATGDPVLKVEWTQFNAAKFNRMAGIVPLFPTTPNDDPTFIPTLVLPSHNSAKLTEAYHLDELATDGYSVESLTRIDTQFAAMIADAQRRLSSESYPVADQIHLNGFSAAGDFATRFAFLYPHLVRALSAGGGGFAPLPTESMTVSSGDTVELPYPLGTADYEHVTGRTFDRAEWNSIAQLFYLGEDDEPRYDEDPTAYQHPSSRYPNRATAVFGHERVTSMFATLQDVYSSTGANASFTLYEDTGHEVTRDMLDDIIAFHSQQLGVLSVTVDPQVVPVNESVDVTVTVTDTTDDAVEGATVEIVSLNESVTTDAGGTATLSVTATKAGDLTVDVTASGFIDSNATLTIQSASDRPADLPDSVSTESFSAVDSDGDGDLSPIEIVDAINKNAEQGSVNNVDVSPIEFVELINWNATH